MMKVTEDAKVLLKKAMKDNDCDCLRVAVKQSGCCGSQLSFTLGKLNEGEQPTNISDVPVVMDKEAQVQTVSLTINAEDGKLVIDSGPSCCG
ncbi:hypothetical protein EWH99_08125 [Sporolactobacillus sp. THM7-7]|nr:hypothetical protein EWH99_08125 [Sporolactobacillus sp. THM7-7]